MQNATQAYSQTAKTTSNPRDLEATLLIKSAAQLQGVQDAWQTGHPELHAVLTYNRKLWTVFVGSVTRPENPLPQTIKDNIASLGLFIFRHTLDIQRAPAPEKLDALININQEIAAGLRARA